MKRTVSEPKPDTLQIKILNNADVELITFTWNCADKVWVNCEMCIFAHNVKTSKEIKLAQAVLCCDSSTTVVSVYKLLLDNNISLK